MRKTCFNSYTVALNKGLLTYLARTLLWNSFIKWSTNSYRRHHSKGRNQRLAKNQRISWIMIHVSNQWHKKVILDSLIRIKDSKKSILDSLIRIEDSKKSILDSLIRNSDTKKVILDSLIRNSDTKKLILDSLIRNSDTKKLILDSLIRNKV